MAIHIEDIKELSKKYRTFLLFFLTPILFFIAISIFSAWYFQPLNGDLTRIGNWAERDYGWNKTQPDFNVQPNILSASTDVLVIGDSFSEPNVWQTHLKNKTGLNTVTYLNSAICIDQIPAFISSIDPKGHIKWVVLESVQRSSVNNFGNTSCSKNGKNNKNLNEIQPFQKSGDPRYVANRPKTISSENIVPIYLAKVAYHSFLQHFQLKNFNKDFNNVDKVVNTRLSRPNLFSSRINDRMLFYADDLYQKSWNAEDIKNASSNLSHLNHKLKALGRSLLLVVVPDKSAVYQDYFAYEHYFGKKFEQSLETQLRNEEVAFVELQACFQKKVREGMVDLYLPNDTHLSLEGFRILADRIAAKIKFDSIQLND